MDNQDLIREVLALKDELKKLQSPPLPQPSLWEKFKSKMSEQGSQRGVFALIPLISYQLDIPTENMVAILVFILGMIGVNNIVTPG